MIPFLKQIAKLVSSDPQLSKTIFVFPNRRAPLFFRKYLSEYIEQPIWEPILISIERFFSSLSGLHKPDRLVLIHELYKAHKKIQETTEPFHRFYFWGDMLLRDFDEIDKHLIDASRLFRDLSNFKDLDEILDFIPEEQKEFLKTFWKNVSRKSTESQTKFIAIWKQLPKIYAEYTTSLKENKMGYEGMIQRQVLKRLDAEEKNKNSIVFVGFNALTKVEEKFICHHVERGARVYWDTDTYYMDDPKQEAGRFLRRYRKHPILASTFDIPESNIKQENKKINLIGTTQSVAQAHLVGQELEKILSSEANAEQTVIVLPDESMLLPVLHALPQILTKANVTMGYPLRATALYTLLNLAILLQEKQKQKHFYHAQVLELLTHAYVSATAKEQTQQVHKKITKQNRTYISPDELQSIGPIGKILFQVIDAKNALLYLIHLLEVLGQCFTEEKCFDYQCIAHMHTHLTQLQKIVATDANSSDWSAFHELFHQTILPQKISFAGDSLSGLQIMGMLETRNLDFENTHILSLNESVLPPPARQNSYLPYRIRKAYQLPTYDDQDAMYAYLFYRLLQRSENTYMYYNTEVDALGNGEVSRYAKQLLYESNLPIVHRRLYTPTHLPAIQPITINKTEHIYALLKKYQVRAVKKRYKLTPSALNDYLDCRLRFYLKHIARLREPEKIEEEPDARMFGNIVHDALHFFYTTLGKKNKGKIEKSDLEKIDSLIDEAIEGGFAKQYPAYGTALPTYKGPRLIARAMIKEWIIKIVEHDKAYAPFTIVILEGDFSLSFSVNSHSILLGGTIDRIDRKKNTLRIIDYKTGGDELNIPNIPSLFAREGKRNKAAFQTFFYAYLYSKQEKKFSENIMPGLMNRKNLFAPNFEFGHKLGKGEKKLTVEDAKLYFNEFEEHLQATLDDLYNVAIPFDQTERVSNCAFCVYQDLCSR